MGAWESTAVAPGTAPVAEGSAGSVAPAEPATRSDMKLDCSLIGDRTTRRSGRAGSSFLRKPPVHATSRPYTDALACSGRAQPLASAHDEPHAADTSNGTASSAASATLLMTAGTN